MQSTMEVVNTSAVIQLAPMHVPATTGSCCMKMDMTVRREAASMRLLHLLEPSLHPIILTITQAAKTVFGTSLLLQDIALSW